MCMGNYEEAIRFLNDAHAKMDKYGTLVDCVVSNSILVRY